MRVTKRDREHMRRLGEAEAEAHSDRRAEHLALDLPERLRRSLALASQFWRTANRAARHDDPTPLYDRARRLGLYRA
ncbi:MAG TPA: hypothetical protein VML75_15740 [Kofleriaceae bacterium]|nr:hypothetical protein [Kofleriaceae bacterium]